MVFPGSGIRLHVFEERYKKMLRYCMDRNEGFGIVLIREGMEANGPLAEIHSVGCMTDIIELEQLPDGRYHINCSCRERFKILKENRNDIFLTGEIEWMPYSEESSKSSFQMYDFPELIKKYMSYIAPDKVHMLNDVPFPENLYDCAIFAVEFLQISQNRKQDLLEIEEKNAFFMEIENVFKHEFAVMDKIRELKNSDAKDFESYYN